MRVGHSRKDLSPKSKEYYLLGYKNPGRNQPAKGIHDPIFSNSLLFDDKGNQVFLWSADLLELPDSIAEDVKTLLNKKFGINRDQIILSVMHDHSSIRDFHTDWPYGKFSQEYYDFFINSIVESFADCLENLIEATAKYGKEIVTGYYSNRNVPGQLADNEVIVVKFFNEQNEPFAGIVNWAVHSTAMGASNMYITGDLAGNTCRKLGEKWGYYPVFINGAAGDCSNRNDRQGKDFDELERETDGLSAKIADIPVNQEVKLGKIDYQTISHTIDTDIESYHQLLRDTIDQLNKGQLKPAGDMPIQHLLDKCEEQLQIKDHKEFIQSEVLDLGDLRFFVFPGELGSVLGKKLKASTKKCALVAGYSNGFHYYFLAKEDYGKSFETIGNPVPKGEPEKIVDKMIQAGSFLEKE